MPRLTSSILSLFAAVIPAIAAHSEQPKFGVIAPISGEFERYGNRVRSGLVSTGMPIARFVFDDEACKPKTALSGMQNYISNRSIRLFVGPYCGASQLAVAKALEAKKSVAVLGTSASEGLFKISGGRMFGVQPSIEKESQFNAERMNEMGIKNVSILLYEGDFSRSYESAFKAAFKGKVLETFVLPSSDRSALRSFAARVRTLKAEAVYTPSVYPLLFGFVKRLRESGLGCLPIFSVFSSQLKDVVAASDGNADQVIYSHPRIGQKDAVAHYSAAAARMLSRAAAGCSTDSCVVNNLRTQNEFDENGTLRGEMELRRFSKRDFTPFNPGAKNWRDQLCG